MNNEKIVKEMASLLRNGATMLGIECSKCGKILFRLKNGTNYCPNCSNAKNSSNEVKNISAIIQKSENCNISNSAYYHDLDNIFSNLILDLSKKLKNCEDKVSLSQILKNISLSLDIIERIKKLQRI